MTIKEINDRIRALKGEKRDLGNRASKTEDAAELRQINNKLENINEQLDEMEEKRSDTMFGESGELEARTAGSLIGASKVIGTYMAGNLPQTNKVKQEERKMIYNTPADEIRDSQEYRNAFFADMMGKPITAEQRAMITTATGGSVIPTSTHNEVIANIQKASGFLEYVRILNVPGKLTIPTSDLNTPSVWHVEGDPIADSTLAPGNVTLNGYELAKLFSMSVATQSMSMAAFESYLVEELTRCTREALADACINGVGATQPLGIIPGFVWDASNSDTYTTEDGYTWDKLVNLMALLPANYRGNAVWTMDSITYFNTILSQADGNGSPIIQKDLLSAETMKLLGKIVVLDDHVPTGTIILGDPMKYFINFSSPLMVERSRDAGFTSGTIMLRSMAVVDGKPVAPAFVKLSKV